MSEKKKGFWSWLGFGKKEQAEQPVEQQAEQVEHTTEIENLNQSIEQLNQTTEQLADLAEQQENEQTAQIEPEQAVSSDEILAEPATVEPAVAEDVEPKIEEIAPLAEQETDFNQAQAVVFEPETETFEIEAEEQVDPIETAIEAEPETELESEQYQEKPSEGGFFSRLIKGLIKTKQNIGSGFRNLFRGKKIDDDLFEELEEQLLIADLGMPTTQKIINNLTQHASKQQLRDAELLYQQLKVELANVLKPVAQPLELSDKKPYVILMVGVNGVGKTTTIGKLARKFQSEGKSVMLAAGDTFRAAAVEQLQVWGERNNIPVVAQATGADSASVIFDAMQSAAAKGIDVLIADTAGRLQNKNHLMDELKKIVRVMKKYDETAPHEIMLTLDAGTGQNAISQAKLFNEAVGLTGITLTKLDGTAKGGVIFAIADQFNIPIRFIGVGEKIDDLRPFHAEEFIEALFAHEDEKND
ncbi:signal recognition particle-docking protein FtsY [Haemophilus paracuniculus]|uniref:Signal recognition particle receptor FtsY n=1 Tax=Haemophilus paracuniculus TaxID=734 RepID=A0A1T0AU23_9PAST|nr:signal recognition particle-docking protein FtsY [Haemophilus paracuniculus]OOR99872.1 signal recognition particle-docking protein FtsY [Haemophilus paracuniculus]